MTLKRFRPRARGRSGKILKPYSKIKILVQEASELKKTDEKKTNEKQIDKSKKNIVLTDKNQINQVKKTEEKQANQTANNLTEDNKDGTKN